MSEIHDPRILILASGGGSTADAYAKAIYEGVVGAEISAVVSSRADVGIVDKVPDWNGRLGFDTELAVINRKTHPKGKQGRGQTDEESEAILEIADRHNVDLIVCLGYLVIVRGPLMEVRGYIPGKTMSMFDASILNSHPGILPETADTIGVGASERVIELGLRATKHTMHLVAPRVDEGPIYAEHVVGREPEDDAPRLFGRVQVVEKDNVPTDVDNFHRDRQTYLASV